MKVAWLCPYPIESLKGIPSCYRKMVNHPSTWVVNLSNSIIKYFPEIELHIITESTKVLKSFILNEDGIVFHVLRSGSVIPYANKGYPPFFPLDVLTMFYKNKKKILNKIKKINPDIIHSHGTEFSYSLTAVLSGYPNIISIQGIISKIIEQKFTLRYYIIKKLETFTIKRGKNFIAKTQFASDFIKSVNPTAAIFHLENPVNEIFFSVIRKNITRKIIFVGSITKEKGIEELLEAFQFVPKANLVIIGTGRRKYLDFLKNKASKLSISSRIKWAGHKTHSEIAKEYESAVAVVLPSHMETSPNVIAEAMCAGVPVIGTNVGGIPYMIKDGINGYLFELNNFTQLSEKINLLLNDKLLVMTMGKNGRSDGIKRFEPKLAAEKIYLIYKNILNN